MNDKTRKIIGTVSIAFIIGLYAIKGLPSFAGKSVSDVLPLFFTSITVTGVESVRDVIPYPRADKYCDY